MDGWIDRYIDVGMDGFIDRWTDRYDEWKSGWMDDR